MTKLYYTPTSCGAASFIAAVAAGLTIEVEQVDISTHKTASGADYYTINPKGNVPALVTNDGVVLNEGAAVLSYIADQVRFTFSQPFHQSMRIFFNNSITLPYFRLPALWLLRTAPRTDTWW